MSDILAATRTYLLTQSGVTDLVATRLYYDNLPQNATLPAVVLYQTAEDATRHLASSDTLNRHGLLLEVYATTHTSAAAVGEALKAAIEMQSGTWGTVDVRGAYVESVVDSPDAPKDGSQNYRRVRTLLCGVQAN